jgi:hypothetical protein
LNPNSRAVEPNLSFRDIETVTAVNPSFGISIISIQPYGVSPI